MGSSKQTNPSTRERQIALVERVSTIAQKLDDRRINAGYAGKMGDSRAFLSMRDELRAVIVEWNAVFSDEDNNREFADFTAKQDKPPKEVKKHASQNRF